MSFFDCLEDALDEGSIDAERGRRAQAEWKERSDRYRRQGHPLHVAEALAAEDVKASFSKEAGDNRHVFLNRIANMREQQAQVLNAPKVDTTRKIEELDYRHRGMMRYFNKRLGDYLKEHHRDLLGRVTKPAQQENIIRALHGEKTGDEMADALAASIRSALEDMRLKFNEAGGIIGKLENWGLPHSHNRLAVTRAGFDRWYSDLEGRIDWTKIEDDLTGRPLQDEGGTPPTDETKRAVLRDMYDNIAFGKGSREAVYGRPQGKATYRRGAEQRYLHFKTADDWIAYNKRFGSGTPHQALVGHAQRMARDIASMQMFGPNPGLGLEYRNQLWAQKAREAGDQKMGDTAASQGKTAIRMLKLLSGAPQAETPMQEMVATFFSSARHVMTSAFLDRAVIASLSDLNTMRLAAESFGMNPVNMVSRHVKNLADIGDKDALSRSVWIADTLADAGAAMDRFNHEIPPADFAERLSSASMRIQGLSYWTDKARFTAQQEMAGFLASQAGRDLKDVEPAVRNLLENHRVTPEDWAHFSNPATLFKAENGATFAHPLWWRDATDLPSRQADEIFNKVQGAIEEFTEIAVPTQSLRARAVIESGNDIPGTVMYELKKSGLMFKSFVMTYSVNQYRQMMSRQTIPGRIGYAVNLVAGATVMGAIALEANALLMGRDPEDMTNPTFWARAMMKGGGVGIMGDIAAQGSSSWGGGFGSYVAGPVPQLAQDLWDISVMNGIELLTGNKTNFPKELARLGRRYTPMGQTPAIGPALDRMVWDQLQILLDPDSVDALAKDAQRRENLTGGGAFWMPGSPVPTRAPDLRTAIGG